MFALDHQTLSTHALLEPAVTWVTAAVAALKSGQITRQFAYRVIHLHRLPKKYTASKISLYTGYRQHDNLRSVLHDDRNAFCSKFYVLFIYIYIFIHFTDQKSWYDAALVC